MIYTSETKTSRQVSSCADCPFRGSDGKELRCKHPIFEMSSDCYAGAIVSQGNVYERESVDMELEKIIIVKPTIPEKCPLRSEGETTRHVTTITTVKL